MVSVVVLSRDVFEGLLAMAREAHPLEMLALLRGRKKGDEVHVEELLFAPLSTHSESSVHFRLDLLPIDFTIVGLAHSHPSGVGEPSVEDMHNFVGRVMLILTPPYMGVEDIHAFDGSGRRLVVRVASPRP